MAEPGKSNAQAAEVDVLLSALASAWRRLENPHRDAYASLEADKPGLLAQPYTNEAIRIMDSIGEDDTDHATLHLLAVMHHARAFDLEIEGKRAAADADWEKALGFWYALSQRPEYWHQLVKKTGQDETRKIDVTTLREKTWPRQLLQVHYDIAMDPATEPERAQSHVRMVQRSSFAEVIKQAVRANAYDTFTKSLDERIWQPEILDAEVIEAGLRRIDMFLQRDPDYMTAYADLLRLLVRLARGWVQEMNATSGQSGPGDAGLQRMCRAAIHWHRLTHDLVNQAATLEPDVRENLSYWYRVLGDLHIAVELYTKATKFLQFAVAATGDNKEREDHVLTLGEAFALEAREFANVCETDKEIQAKLMCDRVLADQPLSPLAHLYLSQAYAAIRKFNSAEELCQAGLRLPLSSYNAPEEIKTHMSDFLQEIAALRRRDSLQDRIQQAEICLEHNDYAMAQSILDAILEDGLSTSEIYILRGQSHLGQYRPELAEADFTRAMILADDSDERRLASELQDQCTNMAVRISELGRDAYRLSQQGIALANAGNYDRAVAVLRRARASAHDPACVDMDLSAALTEAAIATLRSSQDPSALQSLPIALQSAEAMLLEAISLDPSNNRAHDQLDQLSALYFGA